MSISEIAKQHLSISKNASFSLESSSIARQRVGVFVRQGKKSQIEKSIRSRVFSKNKPNHSSLQSSKIAPVFRGFRLAATPFVTLKRRRRGKRPSTKVGHIPRVRGSRKALQTLSAARRSTSSKSTSFSNALWRQLESIAALSTKRASSASNSDRRERRDGIHKQALASLPSTWIRKH